MTEYKLQISPEAQKDLQEIKTYISEDLSSPQAANNTVAKILNSIKNLKQMPNVGTRLSSKFDIETDYRFLACGTYLAFYRCENKTVFIDRIIYGRRDYIKILFQSNNDEE
ncbi:hypothetical protein AGMMS50212_09280 [Spirochaetia bacterium]|nr:hypothetical protein AGMMS50212_09170 [Spirochaetia bacterium]GHV83588.1 hypothetical protein AGMMS50212_09280 [Spirochaetia bacterium]